MNPLTVGIRYADPSINATAFLPFPIELLRRIMEIAAEESTPAAAALSLVCKAVHEWIEPILYETVILEHDHPLLHELETNQKRITYVRRIWLGSPDIVYQRETFDMVCKCINLQRIVVDFFAISAPETMDLTTQSWPSPWEVVLPFRGHTWLEHPFLHNVTHLYLVKEGQLSHYTAALGALPHLTHLGFSSSGAHVETLATETKNLLLAMQSLKMLFYNLHIRPRIYDPPEQAWVDLAQIEDTRLFVKRRVDMRRTETNMVDFLKSDRTIWDDVATSCKDWRHAVVAWRGISV